MRDPSRIDYYCDELADIWHKVPDWRLGQFMTNMLLAYHNTYKHDAFYAEDADFMKFMRDFVTQATTVDD